MKPMATTSPLSRAIRDFAVVGGGIAGCTVAYELARRGHSVTLYEQSSIAHAASGRNMGLLLNQVEVEVVKIMRHSLEIYREVEHAARPFNLRQLPQLLLARDAEQMKVAQAHAAALREIGVEAQPLDPQQVRSEVPQLSEDIQGGYLLPGAWALDPAPATQAFAEAARVAGAEIRTGARVSAIDRHGVFTDEGRRPAGGVIVASGPWAVDLLPSLPVTAARGWVLLTAALPFALPWIVEEMSWPDQDRLGRASRLPTLADVASGGHDEPAASALALAPLTDGRALIGTSMAPSLREAVEGLDMPQRVAARALEIAPGLRDVSIARAWYGMRPMAPDGMPIVGRLGESGVFVHGGHGSLGMMTAPASARWLVDEILGETRPELKSLAPSRFAEPASSAPSR